jgi:hypothetical protein
MWWDAMEGVFGYKTRYLLVGDVNSSYCLLPLANVGNILTGNRIISLPLTQFCGPIFNELEPLRIAIRAAVDMRSKSEPLAIRGKHELPETGSIPLTRRDHYVDYWLDLRGKSQEEISNNFERNRRRALKKAEQLGVEVQRTLGDREQEEIYHLMLRTTNRHGVPPYPRVLIDFIADHMQDATKVYTARLDGRPIAVLTFFDFAGTRLGGYSFALEEDLGAGATTLLMWSAIRDSLDAGQGIFDMGIASPHQSGLRNFKLSFGARETSLPFYFYGGDFTKLTSDPNSSYRRAQQLWRHIPTRLQILLGPPLLRAVG